MKAGFATTLVLLWWLPNAIAFTSPARALRAPVRRRPTLLRAEFEEISAETVEIEAVEIAQEGVEVEAAASPEEVEMSEKQKKINELKAAETFADKETGKYECQVCEFIYDPAQGDGSKFPPGTDFDDLPGGWRCPNCLSKKDVFGAVSFKVSGFAVNQNYGFGGNSMTSDTKNLLIFGGLGAFFILFILGYLLE